MIYNVLKKVMFPLPSNQAHGYRMIKKVMKAKEWNVNISKTDIMFPKVDTLT